MTKKLETFQRIPVAHWLWAGYPGDDLIASWVQCRKTLHLATPPREARVHVTADTRYRLYVNGVRVLDGPARGFQEHWFYDTIDLAPYLKTGDNVVAALVHNLGIGNHSYIHQGFAGFILWSAQPEFSLATDATWRVRRCPEHLRHQTRTSIQTGWQEFVDARRGDGDWMKSGYDDAHWPANNFWAVRPAGGAPWHELAPRDIPLLREQLLTPTRLHATGRGVAREGWDSSRNVVTGLLESQVHWARVDGSVGSIELEAGDSVQTWCLDFGREVMATTLLEITNAAGGETFDLLMTEGCDGAAPIFHPDLGCQMQFGHRYTCQAGDQHHESYQPWGYRFLVVAARGVRRTGLKLNVRVRHVEYPLEQKGRFESANETLTRIYELCAHTQQLCMSDTYVDCPSREQAMWWGDAHCHFDNSQRLDADDRLFVRGLRLMARQTLPNGLTYSHAPTKAHECVLPDFTLMWIETHWQHWWFSGSTELFAEHSEKILRALAYFETEAHATGLLPVDRRYWLFLDWAEMFKEGTPTVYNLQYLRTLELAAEMFTRIGHVEADAIRARADVLRARIATTLWDADRGLPFDGLDWNGTPVAARTLHSRILAIRLGLWPEHHGRWIERDLLPFVRGARPRGAALYTEGDATGDRGAPTPYFMQFLFEVLLHAGYGAAVLDCIERWWGDMLARGLVTTEEAWDAAAGVSSLCHAWTAHPIQFLSSLALGIRQSAAGWREIEFSPVFLGAAAAGTVDTPLGPITSRWRRRDGSIEVSLDLPAGCRARLRLPCTPETTITQQWISFIPEESPEPQPLAPLT